MYSNPDILRDLVAERVDRFQSEVGAARARRARTHDAGPRRSRRAGRAFAVAVLGRIPVLRLRLDPCRS